MTQPQTQTEHALSVTQLTRKIKHLLVSQFSSVMVRGEISGLKRAASGHMYFNLKDEGAVVNCVMWRGRAEKYKKGDIKDGQEVVALGKLDLYEPRGQYNLVVSKLELIGVGTLQQQFEKMKAKLLAEGLFEERHKQPMPFLPDFIGVITSPTGAAVRDVLTTLQRRFPGVRMLLYPAKVQGQGAKEEVVAGIHYLNKTYGKKMDLMIVGRGGGSLEDLWVFNEEVVARAIHASTIPIISAVGHEVDFSIADFVADLRAATPTAAAELAVPDRQELQQRLQYSGQTLVRGLRSVAELARTRLDSIRESYGFRSIIDTVQGSWQQLDDLAAGMATVMQEVVRSGREELALHAAHLEERSPLKVLSRGYSVSTQKGKTLKSVTQVKEGSLIETRVQDGIIESKVESTRKL